MIPPQLAALLLVASIDASVVSVGLEDRQSIKSYYNEQCAECHGRNGISSHDRYPNVAGQKAQYSLNELKSFRAGTRPGTIMPRVASDLSDEQIEQLSLYMSRLNGRP